MGIYWAAGGKEKHIEKGKMHLKIKTKSHAHTKEFSCAHRISAASTGRYYEVNMETIPFRKALE